MPSTPDADDFDRKTALVESYATVAREIGMYEEFGWGINPDIHLRRMKDYPLDFLTGIKDIIDARDFTTMGLFLQLEMGADFNSTDFILDYLHYHKLLGWDEYLMSTALVSLIRRYEGVVPMSTQHRNAAPEVQLQYVALMRFVSAFQFRGLEADWRIEFPGKLLEYDGQHMGRTYAYYIADRDMARLISDNHDRVDEIIAIVKKHDIDNPLEVAFILNGGVPALRDGAL